MLTKYITICLFSIIAMCNAVEMDDRFTLKNPVSNSTFKHWKALGSAIFL